MIQEKTQIVNNYAYIAQEFDIWTDKSLVASEIFDPDGIATRLKLLYFDIPNIVDQSVESDEFFSTLSEGAPTIDTNIFNEEIIQIVIQRAWQESQKIYWLFLALPYFTLLGLSFIWTNFVSFRTKTTDTTSNASLALCFLILLNCLFIECQEIYQMTQIGLGYLKDPYNFIE